MGIPRSGAIRRGPSTECGPSPGTGASRERGIGVFPVSLAAIRSRVQATKRANNAVAAASRGAGTDFAHSVTILRSDIDRYVGPESVQSGRVVFM